MPKLDLEAIPQNNSTGYPPPFSDDVQERWKRRLGPLTGLTHIGATHVVLDPGAWSSQRHWHYGEDEFLVMVEGEAVLVEDEGRTPLHAGDLAAWPKGAANGHHLINESDAPCRFIVFGGGVNTGGCYSDIDMMWDVNDGYVHKDGTPY